MMDFNERVIPHVSSNFMFKEALSRYEFAKRYLKHGMKVLDLGCGTGYGTSILGQRNCEVLGVDINKEAVIYAKKHYLDKNVTFQVGDITKLNSPIGGFDFICSFEVIEHLKNPNKFLINLRGLLSKDGVFILSTPNASVVSPNNRVASPYHTKEFNYDELDSLLKKNFNNVKIFSQTKSKKAELAWKDFLGSQSVRENIVSIDKFDIRALIPKSVKEVIWKYLGHFFGRKTQEGLGTKDFPIGSESVRLACYFVAVSQK